MICRRKFRRSPAGHRLKLDSKRLPLNCEQLEDRNLLAATVVSFDPFHEGSTVGEFVLQTSPIAADVSVSGEKDEFTFNVDEGQSISVVATAIDTLQPSVELFAPSGISVLAAASPGGTALIQSEASESGDYTVALTGQADTIGAYTVAFYLNSSVEEEEYGGPANDQPAMAQDLESAFASASITLPDMQRAAAIGNLESNADSDWYSFQIHDGNHASIALNGITSAPLSLSLYGDDGTTLLTKGVTSIESGQVIAGYTDMTADGSPTNYLLQVSGEVGQYSLFVTRDGDLDIENNDDPDGAQVLTGDDSQSVMGFVPSNGDADYYSFFADSGSQIILTSAVPGDGPGDPQNDLGARLRVTFPNGSQTGNTSSLSIVTEQSGVHVVEVSSQGNTRGTYVLQVDGATAVVTPFHVTSTDLAMTPITVVPDNVTLKLSESVLATSLQPDDLTLNGVAATSVRIVDGHTVRFGLPDAWHPGTNTVAIVEEEFRDIHDTALTAFSRDVEWDNPPPDTMADEYHVDEDTLLLEAAPGVLENDSGATGEMITATLVDDIESGLLVLNADGSFEYTPEAEFSGTVSFTYRAHDGVSFSADTVVTITVDPVNDPPVTVADDYETAFETSTAVIAPGVLGNDSDVDNVDLEAILEQSTTNGTLALNADGSFTYAPDADFYGDDSFSYKAHDGEADSAITTVTISVRQPVVDAGDDAFSVDEDALLSETAPGVLGNDESVTANSITVSLVDDVDHGTLLLNDDGSFDYTPELDFFGEDSFTYLADDGFSIPGEATATITVNPVNDTPIADDDDYAISGNTVLTVDAPGVLDGDVDADGDDISAILVNDVLNGTLLLNADGSFEYTPELEFTGSDRFTYYADDGHSTSNEATVTIDVSDPDAPPTVMNDAYNVDEDTPLTVSAPGVFENDSNVASGFTAALVTDVAHGTLLLHGDGSFEYTPEANFFGVDTFTYRAENGATASAEASVTIDVHAVDDVPTVMDDAFNVDEDNQLTVFAPGVLANDSDVEGDAFTAALVTDVTHGTLLLHDDGSFEYTPEANYFGADTFTYRAENGPSVSADATVHITVHPKNDISMAVDDEFSVDEDELLSVAAPGVLQNDSDIENDPMSVYLIADVENGALTLNLDGSFEYAPAADFAGTDRFTYRVSDGQSTSDVASVFIDVLPLNDPPQASDDDYTVDVGAILNVTAPGVLENDVDIDADSITAMLVADPTHGTLALNPDGSFDYTPTAGFLGSDSFSYEASDGSESSGPATVTIHVTVPNTVPTANTDTYLVDEDITRTVLNPGVLANDTDPESDILTAVLVDDVEHGTLTLHVDGSFVYTPDANYFGTDRFTYRANDGVAKSTATEVTIDVLPINDRPLGNSEHFVVLSATDITVDAPGVLANDTDVEGEVLNAILIDDVDHGSLIFNADGSFVYTPEVGFLGHDSFLYAAHDGQSTSDATIVTLTVGADITAPRIVTWSWVSTETLSNGDVEIEFQFDEPIPIEQIGPGDISLEGARVGTRDYSTLRYFDTTQTLVVRFNSLPEDDYLLVLASGDGAFEDFAGNDLDGEQQGPLLPSGDGEAGGDFELNFAADIDSVNLGLKAVLPIGSLVYDADVAGIVAETDDTDSFLVNLDESHSLTLELTTSESFRADVSVRDNTGSLIGNATASAMGERLLLQLIDVPSSGEYSLDVSGVNGTTGEYDVHVVVNAAIEVETATLDDNGGPASAENLLASFQLLDDMSRGRAATIGVLNDALDEDWYRFELNPGETVTIAAKTLQQTGNVLDLFAADGVTHLAQGITFSNAEQIISQFVGQDSGGQTQYFLRVSGGSGPYNVVLTRGADFDTESNSTTGTAQVSHSVLGAITPIVTGQETLLADFPAIGFNDTDCQCEPPDMHLAVGPDQLVEVVNASIAVYSKNGSEVMPPQELNSFFDADIINGETFIFDPVTTYDVLADRFVVAVLIAESPSAEHSALLYAISDSGDAAGAWSEQHRIEFTDAAPGLFADFPRLGWNADTHVFTFDMYNGHDLEQVNIVAIDKTSVLDANDATADIFISPSPIDHSATLAAATMRDSQPGDPMWFVEQATVGGGDKIRIIRMANILTDSPAFTEFEVAVTPYDDPPRAEQLLGRFNTNDARILSVTWRGDRLVAAHTVGADGVAAARWYEFNTAGIEPLLSQEDTIQPGSGIHTFFPAVDINAAGDIGITFMQSSADQAVSMYVAGHAANTEPNVTSPSTLVRAGDALYRGFRGGDYAGIGVDPSTDTFWAVGEVIRDNAHGSLWNTRIAEFSLTEIPEEDWYSIQLDHGERVEIRLTIPPTEQGLNPTTLEPVMEFYAPDGQLIQALSNLPLGAAFIHTAYEDGEHQIRIRSANDSVGAYFLSIDGPEGPHTAPEVVFTDPVHDKVFGTPPESITLGFSEPILISSVTADDLRIADSPALSLTVIDGRTFEFGIDPSIYNGDTLYDVVLDAGSVTSLSGEPTAAFETSFEIDQTGPRILASTWNGQAHPESGTFRPGPLDVEFTFDERLFALSSARRGLRTPGVDDVILFDKLSGQSIPADVLSIDQSTLTLAVQFGDLTPSEYQLRLISGDGGFEDFVGNDLDGEFLLSSIDGLPSGDGNAGGDFIIEFIVAPPTHVLSDFERARPLGSYTLHQQFEIESRTWDRYEFAVSDNELVTTVITPQDVDTLLIVDGQPAAAAGESILIQQQVDVGGSVSFEVQSAEATDYIIEVTRSAAMEQSMGDSSVEFPLALDPSIVLAQHTVTNVLGSSDLVTIGPITSRDVDVYQLDLSASVGNSIDVILAGLTPTDYSGSYFEIIDPTGNVVATSAAMSAIDRNFELAVFDFLVLDVADNRYRIQFSSNVSGAYILTISDSAFLESEPNDTTDNDLRVFDRSSTTIGFQDAATDLFDIHSLTAQAKRPILIRLEESQKYSDVLPQEALDTSLFFAGPTGFLQKPVAWLALSDSSVIATVEESTEIFVGLEALSGLGEYSLEFDFATNNGDLNGDGVWDCIDVDTLSTAIAQQSEISSFDISDDGSLDEADFLLLLAMVAQQNFDGSFVFSPGDANLDGAVDADDLMVWTDHSFSENTGWCSGDFSLDGVTDVQDFNIWNDHKFSMAASAAPTVRQPRAPLAMPAVADVLAVDVDKSTSSRRPELAASPDLSETRKDSFHDRSIHRDHRTADILARRGLPRDSRFVRPHHVENFAVAQQVDEAFATGLDTWL